jgi:pilus assembly protein CpaB
MKPARILVLAVALVAGLVAALLASNSKPPEIVVQAPPPAPTDAVLVAAKELHRDEILDQNSMRWEPKDNIPEGSIRKSAEPDAIDHMKGWTVTENIYNGDYLRRERVSKDPRSGLLGSLHSGMRAVSINIDTQGSSTAGGFILPNHFVDVIHIFPFKEEHFLKISQNEPLPQKIAGDSFVSRTIVTNVRVLAIGQKDQVVNAERAVTGVVNATLEVTPEQAETLLLAQRTDGNIPSNTLHLILRSMGDVSKASDEHQQLAGDLKVIRGGDAKQYKAN